MLTLKLINMIQDIRTITKKGSKWNKIQVKEKDIWRNMDHVNENEKKVKKVKQSFTQKLKNLFK
tara:strand:- start:134 stop:325 length:192 start_codon:yes stop_codon:yes gene_type:complete